MKKFVIKTLLVLGALYIFLCLILFFEQEKLIFHPEKLDKEFSFLFVNGFEEINIKATDRKLLNGLLFKAQNSKGLIVYFHGNAGSLNTWGNVAQTYNQLNYDVFMFDYRGYGKSEGEINTQQQLFDDSQQVYNEMKKRYAEDKIVVLGYSIGTGLAAKLASQNNPKLLILQAPYYSLTDMMQNTYSIIPTFILKYKFETNDYLKTCKMPVVLFHGNRDEVIYYGSSLKLKEEFKPQDTLITLNGQSHNQMTYNEDYKATLQKILAK